MTQSTTTLLEHELCHLVTQAAQHNITLRALGGVAVKIHSRTAEHRTLSRDYPDIDFITDKAGGRRLASFLKKLGYIPNRTVNALHGTRRQIYYHPQEKYQIDFFVGEFEMCHKLPIGERLSIEPFTIPLAELFLTKAQIVQLNYKDILDLIALLLDHPVGSHDHETINADRIARLCARDWGLYQTVKLTLQKLNAFLDNNQIALKTEQIDLIRQRLNTLQEFLELPSRSLGWKMRAKLGTHLRWYNEVEEVQR